MTVGNLGVSFENCRLPLPGVYYEPAMELAATCRRKYLQDLFLGEIKVFKDFDKIVRRLEHGSNLRGRIRPFVLKRISVKTGSRPDLPTHAAVMERRMSERFRALAEQAALTVGSYWAFMIALVVVIVWAVTGPIFDYSDTWQLAINTGTTIVTFLMVFLIQNTQNRETRIVRLKLDELLRGVEGARTSFINLDHMSDKELRSVQREFERLREKYAVLVEDDIAHVERELRSRSQPDTLD